MLGTLTLRAKLLGLMSVITVISLAMFGLMAWLELNSIRQAKGHFTETLAEGYIDKVDRNLFERYGDVQAFALSEPARSGSAVRINAFMNDMMGAYTPIYDVMMVVNSSGHLVSINSVDKNGKDLNLNSLLGHDFSSTPWFKEAMAGKIPLGSAFVEDVQIDPVLSKALGQELYYMNFTAPIRDKESGAILGVWTNRMSWADVVESLTSEELKEVRSGELKDIFAFIVDRQGNYIVHPDKSKTHHAQMNDYERVVKESKETPLIEMIELSENYFKGDAFQAVASSKGYSIYPGRGWIAGIQVSSAERALDYAWGMIAMAFVIFSLLLFVGWLIIGRIAKSLRAIVTDLNTESGSVRTAAAQISTGSKNLANASTVQASAIQETASAVEQTNAMVKKSADNAMRSRDVSNSSHEAASRGKESVEEMRRAIEDINVSNENIMKQISESNQQISEIVKVITEIGNKTKVINDIVFQTKLLSFNASVEAARAGEHGKGFAVVAEEVGNLAQMSGNAAKEIADMLNSSIQRVEGIVSHTKSQVERLIAEGKSKVQSGTIVAKQCGEILDEVVRNVSEVNEMIGEISTAAQEQSQGVSEITKAINQLDESTHNNATTSQESSKSAEQLTKQAEKLHSIVSDLESIIEGKSHSDLSSKAMVSALRQASQDLSPSTKAKSLKPDWKNFDENRKKERSHTQVPGIPLSMPESKLSNRLKKLN